MFKRLFRRKPRAQPEPWDIDHATAFLSVGRLSLPEYLALDDETRAAIVAAGARLRADEILTLASAIRGEGGAERAAQVAYGAEESEAALMLRAFQQMKDARRGRRR